MVAERDAPNHGLGQDAPATCHYAKFPQILLGAGVGPANILIKENHIMSATAMLQLKQQISRLSDKERKEIAAFLHRLKQQSPAWQKEMTCRMAEMDQGKKFHIPKPSARA